MQYKYFEIFFKQATDNWLLQLQNIPILKIWE